METHNSYYYDLESMIKEFGYDLSTQNNLCNLIERRYELKEITKKYRKG